MNLVQDHHRRREDNLDGWDLGDCTSKTVIPFWGWFIHLTTYNLGTNLTNSYSWIHMFLDHRKVSKRIHMLHNGRGYCSQTLLIFFLKLRSGLKGGNWVGPGIDGSAQIWVRLKKLQPKPDLFIKQVKF